MTNNNQPYIWSFQYLGATNQVILKEPADIANLEQLDPKLWIALSCPVENLEFDKRTLELIDTDGDKRIRMPEILAAAKWMSGVLSDISSIIDPPESLPLTCLNGSEEGKQLTITARAILKLAGKSEESSLSREDVANAGAMVAQNALNGDGIFTPHKDLEPPVNRFIEEALAIMGGVLDAGGQPGINMEIAEGFVRSLKEWAAWNKNIMELASPIGRDTVPACALLQKLKTKIDDYFLRCSLAAYAPQSTASLNPAETLFENAEKGLININDLAELPISRIAAARPLDLASGINPAWQEDVGLFFNMAKPLLEEQALLTSENWQKIKVAFDDYEAAMAKKPLPEALETSVTPTKSVDDLGMERVEEILNSGLLEEFGRLVARDMEVPLSTKDIASLERLVLYHRHLYRLFNNFVSFKDFYTNDHKATFRAGTLYIDGRSSILNLPVSNIDGHAVLAGLSQLYLLYCECKRSNKDDADQGPQGTRTIVAAVTAGDADLLLPGRNGVFIDNQGYDWDATVIKVVSSPISLREAAWSPYKRLARMVGEQINKFAGARQDNVNKAADAAAQTPASPPPSFDIAKSAGIFAAIGLALGAIGTALATLASALFSLKWWQFPLIFVGLFLLISGPSMILAFLKLRRRSLGPLLEASGWAVNYKLPISLPLAKQLTFTAKLPKGAKRNYRDPLRQPKRWPIWVLIIALVASALAGWWWLYFK